MVNYVSSGNDKHISIQLLRYGVVAGVAFVIDFGLLYVFTTWFHIFYLVSATLSFSFSLFINYLLSTNWVFTGQSIAKKHTELILFILLGVSGLLLNIGIIWVLTSFLGVYYLASKIISTVIVFGWSFTGRRMMYRSH